MKTLALSRKMTFGALALAAAVSGAAIIVTGGCSHRGDDDVTHVDESGATEKASATRIAMLRGRAEAPGLLHVYSVKLEQDLGFVAKQKEGERKEETATVKLAVTAELRLAFVGTDGDRHRIFGQMANVKVDFGRGADASAIAAEMEKPFYFSTETDGRVRGYAFARGLSSIAQNLVRGLIGQAQVSARPEKVFEVSEDDIHGSYVASYARGASGEVKKTKVRYEGIATNDTIVPPDQSARVTTGGQTIATLDESGWIVRLTSDEKKVATMGDDMPTASTHLRLEMNLTSTRRDESLSGRFDADRGGLVMAGPFGSADQVEAKRVSDEKLVGQRSLGELVSIARATEGEQARGAVAEQMAARFRLTPGSTGAAAETVSKLSVRDGQLLTSALASAGTPEATRALGTIANDKRAQVDVRAQAATQLAFAGKNSAEAREALLQAMGDGARDVRASAALALGSVARELDGDPTAVGELVHSYREAATDDDRVTFLHALGNSGSPEMLSVVREALASPNESVREAATQALRFLPLGEADVLLDAIVLRDESENVRQAAVDALGFRIVERHVGVLSRVLATDGSAKVKAEIAAIVMRTIATRGSTLSPQARAALNALLASAPAPSAQ